MRIEASEPAAPPPAPRAAAPTSPARTSFRALVGEQPLNAAQARALLGDAWTAVVGNFPNPSTSALLTAHWALETDAGRCMPGHNFAGIKAAPGASSARAQSFRTIEGHGASRREVNARFRMYESAEAGAHDYVRLLATRYPDAIAAARVGDSHGFAHALARGGYFTADPAAYAAGLEQRLAALQSGSLVGSTTPSAPPDRLNQLALDGLLRSLRPVREAT